MSEIIHFFPELYRGKGLDGISKNEVDLSTYVTTGHASVTKKKQRMKGSIDKIVSLHKPRKIYVGKTNNLFSRKNNYASFDYMFALYKSSSKDFQSTAEVDLIAFANRKYPHLIENISDGSNGRKGKKGPYYVYIVIGL